MVIRFNIWVNMNRICTLHLLILILVMSKLSYGQKHDGYVITKNDSLISGYIRFDVGTKSRGSEIRLYENKRSEPLIFYTLEVNEYAYKRDTFKIIRNLYPFDDEDLFVDQTEAKMLESGKVSLYKISVEGHAIPMTMTASGVPVGGGKMARAIYLLDDHQGNILGVKKDNFNAVVTRYFGSNEELILQLRAKKFTYKDLKKVTRIFNKGDNNN